MEEEIEVWKECGKSKLCIYEVSNLGRVKSIVKKTKIENILKGVPDSHGYLRVKIVRKILIHHLVAYAFLGPRPEGLQIDHIDRNKLNNKADNLRYCTRSKNIKNRDDYRDDILEEDPKERKKIISKEGYEANREERLEKVKKYREANREKILEKFSCCCGGRYTKQHKAEHEKTKKHLVWLATQS